MMVSTVHKGHQVIADAVVEKRTKARRPEHPQGTMKTNQTPTAVYIIEEWIQGLEKDTSEVDVIKMAMQVIMGLSSECSFSAYG